MSKFVTDMERADQILDLLLQLEELSRQRYASSTAQSEMDNYADNLLQILDVLNKLRALRGLC